VRVSEAENNVRFRAIIWKRGLNPWNVNLIEIFNWSGNTLLNIFEFLTAPINGSFILPKLTFVSLPAGRSEHGGGQRS
jgi:hypothetical protein